MGIFSDIKKYRQPSTDIDEKIRKLDEGMVTGNMYITGVTVEGQPEISGDTPDDEMGDLADTNNFTVADQTGSSPDMSQLTTTDAYGNTVNRLSTPAGSGGLAVIRYANFGVLNGTYYGVLRSDNTVGDSWLTGATSGNGGTQSVGDWVNANYGNWETVQWHYYKTPGMADNVFNPIARNVGPGGGYTLWGASLLVVKNPNFVSQKYIATVYQRTGFGNLGVGYNFFRSRLGGSGGRAVSRLLFDFANSSRGVGGFAHNVFRGAPRMAGGKKFNKWLRAAAKAGINVGDLNQATDIYFGRSPATPTPSQPSQPPAPRPVDPEPPSGTQPKLPDYPDKGLEKMPTIQPDPKPDPKPTPPKPDPKPTPPKPDPKPVPPGTPPPAPDPKPRPTPPSTPKQPYNPPPEDLAKIGAPAPPPPPGYGDRGKFYDDYIAVDFTPTGHPYVDGIFSGTKAPYAALFDDAVRDAKSLDKYEKTYQSYMDMELPAGDSFGDRMRRQHIEREREKYKGYVESLKRGVVAHQKSINKNYLDAKNDFEYGGDLEQYINAYKDSHPQEVTKVAKQEVERLKTGESVPETSPISKAIASAIAAIPKNVELPLLSSARVLAQYAKNIQNTGKGGTIANPMTSGEVDEIINNIDLNTIGDYSTPEQMIKSAVKQLSAAHTIFGSGGYNVQIDDSGITISDPSYKFDTGGANPIPGQAWGDYLAGWLWPVTLTAGLALFGVNPPKAAATVTQKIPMSQIKAKNPKLYQKLQENPNFGRKGVKESYLQESIEFENETGMPIDHVANVMNGVADALDVLNKCFGSLFESSERWRRATKTSRFVIAPESIGSEFKPFEIILSENTNKYLLTNGNTGFPYNPETDGKLSEFVLNNAYKNLHEGGNVSAKSILGNFLKTPKVEIDKDANISITGEIYLFNKKAGIEYSILSQVLDVIDEISQYLGIDVEGFSEEFIRLYNESLSSAFPGMTNLDAETPILNVAVRIPADQAQLYTMNRYLFSPEDVKESTFQRWKRETSPENRRSQGEYEFFLSALSVLPEVARNYIRMELKMRLGNLLLPVDQQMDPKMITVQSMVNASDSYVETHFPENEKLFKKLQKSIAKNIKATEPKIPKPIKEEKKAPRIKKSHLKRNVEKKCNDTTFGKYLRHSSS